MVRFCYKSCDSGDPNRHWFLIAQVVVTEERYQSLLFNENPLVEKLPGNETVDDKADWITQSDLEI